jgi:superfamily I DNA/RNA helicase
MIGIENREYKNRKELEEERRLFFVGMTRAKDILIMTSPDNRKTPLFIKETKVSITKH